MAYIPRYDSPTFDPEVVARVRILAIIDYLNRIQERRAH